MMRFSHLGDISVIYLDDLRTRIVVNNTQETVTIYGRRRDPIERNFQDYHDFPGNMREFAIAHLERDEKHLLP